MKKGGILNQALMSEITGLGHGDVIMICDASSPAPGDVKRIDLALVKGIPGFRDCLEAVLSEMIVEAVAVPAPMETANPETFRYIMSRFVNQKKEVIPNDEFKARARNARFVLRSGDLTPYSNILLTSASGAQGYFDGFEL